MEKIILTADLHIQDGLYCQVGLDYLDYLSEFALSNGINKIAFLGDLLDKSSRIKNDMFVPLFKKIDQMKETGLEMWFIFGNHDITSTVTNSSILEVFEKYGHLVNSIQTYELGNYTINMSPFTKDPALVPTVNADYLFTHLNIMGFDLGGGRIAGEEQQAFPVSMFSNYKMVFTGHYHKRQCIGNVQYIGAPYQLNFGDAGDYNKGFEVLNLEDGSREFIIYDKAPKFKKYSYDDLWKFVHESIDGCDALQNSLVKIIIDRKVDGLAKLKTILYNKFNVIDIVNEFENKRDDKELSETKIDMNISIDAMVKDFLTGIKKDVDGFEINGSELVEKFEEIKSEI